ncbi:MAG TPA: NYN domain-containing protein [Alphaproteobacteria bacterium]|nr:NYN domain-containing protein [Alphaproteobacteria bacterium]
MTLQRNIARLAVFIDADNASPHIAEALFDEIAKLGEAGVRRIYGDFSSPRIKGWADILMKHALIPHQQYAYTKGKNASDIALVIDAMDLLHKGGFDGFCLVSSDSDFTRLSSRIREEGVAVYGFGEEKTPESFRQACSRFIYTENLKNEKDENQQGKPNERHPPSKAAPLLIKALELSVDEAGEWGNLSEVGSHLEKLASDFDPRSYGQKNLSALVEKAGCFEVRKENNKVSIRRK